MEKQKQTFPVFGRAMMTDSKRFLYEIIIQHQPTASFNITALKQCHQNTIYTFACTLKHTLRRDVQQSYLENSVGLVLSDDHSLEGTHRVQTTPYCC